MEGQLWKCPNCSHNNRINDLKCDGCHRSVAISDRLVGDTLPVNPPVKLYCWKCKYVSCGALNDDSGKQIQLCTRCTLPTEVHPNWEKISPIERPIKDSGERVKFDTGSHRDSADGKGRFDLLPYEALLRYAVHMEKGCKKYGDRNWEKGQPFSRTYQSALRHLLQWGAGHKDEDHLAAAFWNIGAIITFEARIAAGTLPKFLMDMKTAEDMSEDASEDLGCR